jgi:hypothetical protein
MSAEDSTRPSAAERPPDTTMTVAQVRRMLTRESHPTWFQASYVDLARRLEALTADVAALHVQLGDLLLLLQARLILEGVDRGQAETPPQRPPGV